MQYRSALLSLFASTAAAQSLTDVLASTPQLSTLATLVKGNSAIVGALSSASNITVLAPNNDAFSMFLNSTAGKMAANDSAAVTALLQYHVLKGTYESSMFGTTPAFAQSLLSDSMYTNVTGGQVVEAEVDNGNVTLFSGLLMSSTVVQADVKFNGGVVHIINNVLTIPANVSTTATAANLTSLVSAIEATNLTAAVDTTKDVTIFAPNNAAFAAINGTISKLNASDIAKVLEYHVVAGTVGYSTDLKNMTLTTLNGANVTITIVNGTVFVDSAKVIKPNVLVANGVVHVIDNVLNPSSPSATPNPTATAGMPAFSGASTTGSSGGSSSAAAVPMATGGVAMAALFGVGAAFMNA